MLGYRFRQCLTGKAFLRNTHETFCLEDFKCDFLTFYPYYICPHYPQKYQRPFREKNPRQIFYNTTHSFFRESYSSLVRNHCNLFSFLLPLSYLEKRFVPKHKPYHFKIQRVFWSLGSFGDLPKEVDEAWWMQLGILRDSGRLEKTGFQEAS